MKNHLRHFVFIGLLLGSLYGLGNVIFSYFEIPGIPGPYEILIQFAIIVIQGLLAAFIGLLAWSACMIIEKLYLKRLKAS